MKNTNVLLCLVACSLIAGGCVGRREARRVTSGMIQTSDKAAKVVSELKEATLAETEAYQETRRTVAKLHEAWFQNRRALALTQIHGEFLRVSNRVSTDLANYQLAIIAKRIEATTNVAALIKLQVAPLQERSNQLLQQVRQAQNILSNAPGELRLIKELAEADRSYALTLGRKIEIERDAFRDGVAALDGGEKDALDSLRPVALEHWAKIKEVYTQGVQNIQSITATSLDLGPEPINNTNAFNDLYDYTVAIGKCGEGLEEYFIFNSLGKGSLFDTLLQSLGQGFIKALPIVGDGKGVSWSEAGDAGGALLKEAVTEIKGELSEAGETAKGALGAAANTGLEKLTNRLQQAIDKLSPANQPTTAAANH